MLCLINLCTCKEDPLARLPDFSFRLADSTTIVNSKDIPEGSPIVIINFEADCSGCQQTTDTLLQHMDTLKGVRFYFLTVENLDKVRLFRDHFHLERYSNIIIGQDNQRMAHSFFKVRGTPLIALYHANKQLAGIYDGKPLMQSLLNSIEDL
jgi:peroxiredoxin